MILQMVDGAMTFTVNNGRGPIVAVFKPDYKFRLCDGQWHEIHAVKAKVQLPLTEKVDKLTPEKFIPQNVVTLSVNDVFAQPGIGVPGVSSTDTNHGLFIGGHPQPGRQGDSLGT